MVVRKVLSFVLCASLVASTSGCSVFQPRQQHVTITASEPGAQIFVNNDPVGYGTASLELDRDRTYAVSATSAGRTGTAAIGRQVSGTGILDIVGGCLFLVPFVGCFTPGFWELDRTTVSIPVPPSIAQQAPQPPARSASTN